MVKIPLKLIEQIKCDYDLCKLCPPEKKLICYLNKSAYCEEYKFIRQVRNKVKKSRFVAFPMVCWDCQFLESCRIFKRKKFKECHIARGDNNGGI